MNSQIILDENSQMLFRMGIEYGKSIANDVAKRFHTYMATI